MATITATKARSPSFASDVQIVTWTPLANGDSGSAIEMGRHADKSVQILGTFGSGGTVVFQGSNDGTNWVTLNNLQGTALSVTSATIKGVAEMTRYVRPSVTAGDGTTSITVVMAARGVK